MHPYPSADNAWLAEHVELLLNSYRLLLGRDLLDPQLPLAERAHQLFTAPYGVFSHSAAADPIFTYGNQTALRLFELDWPTLQAMPSRLSAETPNREERQQLLAGVARDGYFAGYRGLRISRSGRRFWIEDVCVWNLLDAEQRPCGQAAVYGGWTYVD